MSSVDEPTPQAADDATSAPSAAQQHPVLVYTTWRIAIFIVVLVVLYLVGLRDVWLLVLAFLVSGVASIFLLNRRRQNAVGGFSSVFSKLNSRIDASTRAEDGDDGYVGHSGVADSAGENEPKAE